MAYDYDRPVIRTVFEPPSPLAGLTIRLYGPTVDSYILLDSLADDSTPAAVEQMCDILGPLLIEWDLKQNGEPVTADLAGLRSLDVFLGQRITRELINAIGQVPDPLAQPSSDGNDSLAGSIPMETPSGNPLN